MLTQNSALYQKEVDGISNTQLNFMNAVINNEQKNIYHHDIIEKYDLGTTGNVTKIIDALSKKEIIHKPNGTYDFIDPAFKMWFKMYYLKT